MQGNATVAKMHENVLTWKGFTDIGLEKMAAQQDLMIKAAEAQLEDLQEKCTETAQVRTCCLAACCVLRAACSFAACCSHLQRSEST